MNCKMVYTFFLLFTGINIFPQIDSTRAEFFPLQIGNLWQYRNENNNLAIQQVVGDTILDGERYFLLIHSLRSTGGRTRIDLLMRIQNRSGLPNNADSCGGNNSYEWSIYHLAEVDSTVWSICSYFNGMLTYTPLVRLNGITISNIFGQPREVIHFEFGGVIIDENDTTWNSGAAFAKGIGILGERYFEGEFYELQGAIINGEQYGTIVSVENEITETFPEKIILHQNFPNPFNPTTKITYALSEDAAVKIKVYDLLGTEMAELVNESKPAGFYEVDFDASQLSSGVYIYRLAAASRKGTYTEAKQMMLVK